MIAYLFYSKKIRTTIQELSSKGNLNFNAVENLNRLFNLYFFMFFLPAIFGWILFFVIFFDNMFDFESFLYGTIIIFCLWLCFTKIMLTFLLSKTFNFYTNFQISERSITRVYWDYPEVLYRTTSWLMERDRWNVEYEFRDKEGKLYKGYKSLLTKKFIDSLKRSKKIKIIYNPKKPWENQIFLSADIKKFCLINSYGSNTIYNTSNS